MSVHDDEILGKAYDSRLMRRLLGYLAPYKWRAVVALLALGIYAARQSARKDHEKAAIERAEDAASCQKERAMTDDDAMAQCQTAAALFGQDISQNATRLSACVEHREHALAQCTAKGL